MTSAVASRYARAFADVVLAPESDLQPLEAVAQLRLVQELMEQSSDLRHALSSPAVRPTPPKRIFNRAAAACS